MSNHLARETSPYLQQHADNPVDWHPWGEEALRLDNGFLMSPARTNTRGVLYLK